MRAVSHIAIGVRDMERSLHFYRDLLGLRVTLDTMENIGGLKRLFATRSIVNAIARRRDVWELSNDPTLQEFSLRKVVNFAADGVLNLTSRGADHAQK